jgi:hypothetical protein
MKKFYFLFAAIAVTFLMSADLHSSNKRSSDDGKYCVYFWTGRCYKSTIGDACYAVDANCNWIDEQIPED